MNNLVKTIDYNQCGNFAELVKTFEEYVSLREELKDITVANMQEVSDVVDVVNQFMTEFENIITTDDISCDINDVRYAYLSLLKLRVRAHYMLYFCLNPAIRMPDVQTQFDEYVTGDRFMHNIIKSILT